jgi:hypothetical protein
MLANYDEDSSRRKTILTACAVLMAATSHGAASVPAAAAYCS